MVNSQRKLEAGYQCLNTKLCGQIWTTPKPVASACPRCGFKYVKWLNYHLMFPSR